MYKSIRFSGIVVAIFMYVYLLDDAEIIPGYKMINFPTMLFHFIVNDPSNPYPSFIMAIEIIYVLPDEQNPTNWKHIVLQKSTIRAKECCTNRESNPGQMLGRHLCYHYTIGAITDRNQNQLQINHYNFQSIALITRSQCHTCVLQYSNYTKHQI